MPVLDAQPKFAPPPIPDGAMQWLGHMSDDVAATYGPEPLASLTATAESLILESTRGTFRIPRAAVLKLGRGKMYPWFFKGIRIHHRVPEYPTTLQFQSLDAPWRDVRQQLKEMGYPAA